MQNTSSNELWQKLQCVKRVELQKQTKAKYVKYTSATDTNAMQDMLTVPEEQTRLQGTKYIVNQAMDQAAMHKMLYLEDGD